MGAGFAGHVQALGFRLADQINAFLRGNVADVVAAACLPNQFQIPLDLTPLAFGADAPVPMGLGVGAVVDVAAVKKGIVLAVGNDGLAQRLGCQHGSLHHFLRLNAPPVIGKARHVGSHALKIRQHFSFFANGNGAVGVNVDAGGVPDLFQLQI